MADYSLSLRHRRDGNAGTTILYHLRNYRRPHSSSVMTAGRRELLEDGHRRRAVLRVGPPGRATRRAAGRAARRTIYSATAPLDLRSFRPTDGRC